MVRPGDRIDAVINPHPALRATHSRLGRGYEKPLSQNWERGWGEGKSAVYTSHGSLSGIDAGSSGSLLLKTSGPSLEQPTSVPGLCGSIW